jgi:vacuolar-type H+-ATPase subunit H
MDFDRLRRGRASAKNSRLRKKLYIDLLETKLEKLEEERQKLAKALHEAREGLAKASTMAQQTAGGFTVGRQHTIKKLEQLVSKTEEGDAEEVNIILDSLRYRISATGKERVNSVNEYFRQIANTCFPALNRYLMWSALERRHLFSADPSNDPDEWFRDFFNSMNLSA